MAKQPATISCVRTAVRNRANGSASVPTVSSGTRWSRSNFERRPKRRVLVNSRLIIVSRRRSPTARSNLRMMPGPLHTRFGDVEKNRNNLTAALAAYKRSTDIFGRMATSDEKNLVALRDWVQAMKSVGVTEIKLGQTENARKSIRSAIDAVNRLKAQNALGNGTRSFSTKCSPFWTSCLRKHVQLI